MARPRRALTGFRLAAVENKSTGNAVVVNRRGPGCLHNPSLKVIWRKRYRQPMYLAVGPLVQRQIGSAGTKSSMCGIVGVLGHGPVAGPIVDALKRLEYRGYDSAGVATLENGRLERRRAEGKLKNLEAKLAAEPLGGAIGIGHTRWATHGKPTVANAHPHASPRLAVVHNGIIENFKALREELAAKGYRFATETDSEIAAFAVEDELAQRQDARAGGSGRASPAARRVRARLSVRGRGRPPDRRAAGRAARDRLWRRRDVSRLRRARARPVHRPHRLSRGGRLGGGDARRRRHSRPRRETGQAPHPAQPGRQPAGGEGQLSPLHGQGDPRAARGCRPHPRPLRRHGGDAAEAVRLAGRPDEARARHDRRLRHRLYGRAHGQVLDRAVRAPAGRDRRRLGIPLSRGAGRRRRA